MFWTFEFVEISILVQNYHVVHILVSQITKMKVRESGHWLCNVCLCRNDTEKMGTASICALKMKKSNYSSFAVF